MKILSADRWLRNSDGDLVLGQMPNPPLITWMVARVLEVFVRTGWPARLLDVVAFGALFTWAWLEIFDGDTYLRRLLGLVVMVAIVWSRVA